MKKSEEKGFTVGTKLSRVSYMEVVNVGFGIVTVKNEEDFSWDISSYILEKECYTADQYEEKVKVTRTELINIFTTQTRDTIFTVNFNKQAKIKDIVDAAIARDEGGKFKTNKEIAKMVKTAEKGEERTLVGYMLSTENGFGRSVVIDLEQDKGDIPTWDARTRQVDHRSLNWLILKNVKYIVK